MKSAVAIILANLKSNIGDFAILHAILLDLQEKYPGRALHVFPLGHYQIDEGRIAAFRQACNIEFELAGKTYTSEMDAKLLQEKFLRLVGLWPLVQKRLVRSLAETVADDAMRFREYEAIFLAGGERGGGTRGGVSLFATLEAVQRHNDRIYTFPFSITPQVLRFNTRSSLRRYFEKIKDPVLVRDSSSARFLERTGVRSVLGGDCVYSLEALAWQVSKKEGRDAARILLAFTGRRVESAVELTRALRRLTGCGYRFALMTSCETEDGVHFKSVSREFGIDYIAPMTWQEAVAEIKASSLLVTNRLHGMIFGSLAKTPLLVVANRKKAQSFVADSRLPISVQRISDLTPDLLARCLSERHLLLDRIESYNESIRSRIRCPV